jgi:hypothetical protein
VKKPLCCFLLFLTNLPSRGRAQKNNSRPLQTIR